MHPILMSALVRMRQAELLRDGERHRLAASLRRYSSAPWPPLAGLRRVVGRRLLKAKNAYGGKFGRRQGKSHY